MIVKYYKNILDSKIQRNFGDSINPVIWRLLTGKKPTTVNLDYKCRSDETVYMMSGSVLEHACENTIVWGTGFISKNSRLRVKPKKICAVRGPLTRSIVVSQNIPCPRVYGDPVLLMGSLYMPIVEVKYDVGVIPHYIDKNVPLPELFTEENGVTVIDVQQDVFSFIKAVLACRVIASSSLHGLILADAYGIPSVWIKLSNNIAGGDFKFLDYFMSVFRTYQKPLWVNVNTTIDDIFARVEKWNRAMIDKTQLLEAFPYYA